MDRPSSPMGEVRVSGAIGLARSTGTRDPHRRRTRRRSDRAGAPPLGGVGQIRQVPVHLHRRRRRLLRALLEQNLPNLAPVRAEHKLAGHLPSIFTRHLLLPGGGMPIGRQSSDRARGGPSRRTPPQIRKLCGPSISSADAANFRSNTARLFSSGARPGPSVLGRPTTTTSPSATSHVCTHPSAPPLSIVSPSGRGSRQRTPEYVVVPSLRWIFEPGACASAMRCTSSLFHRNTGVVVGSVTASPFASRRVMTRTPSAPSGNPVTTTSRRTNAAETTFSPPIPVDAEDADDERPSGSFAPDERTESFDRDARTAREGRFWRRFGRRFGGGSGDPGRAVLLLLREVGERRHGLRHRRRLLLRRRHLRRARHFLGRRSRDAGRWRARLRRGSGHVPAPGLAGVDRPRIRRREIRGRRPSLRRPISPTHAPPSSSSPKRARRHTLMCFAPYVTNSSIPGNGFQTTPFTIGGKPLMPCPSPTSSYDPSPNFQLSACASIDSRAAASAAAFLDALLDVRAVGGPLPAPASAALDGAAVAAFDARGAPIPPPRRKTPNRRRAWRVRKTTRVWVSRDRSRRRRRACSIATPSRCASYRS